MSQQRNRKGKKYKSNWREYFIHGLPLAYLGGFGLGFGQVHFLQPQICCWYVHLEVWVSVVGLEVEVPQIFRYSSHLHEILPEVCAMLQQWQWQKSHTQLLFWWLMNCTAPISHPANSWHCGKMFVLIQDQEIFWHLYWASTWPVSLQRHTMYISKWIYHTWDANSTVKYW